MAEVEFAGVNQSTSQAAYFMMDVTLDGSPLESEDWDKVKNILIQMEGMKLKYIGEYDYGHAV